VRHELEVVVYNWFVKTGTGALKKDAMKKGLWNERGKRRW